MWGRSQGEYGGNVCVCVFGRRRGLTAAVFEEPDLDPWERVEVPRDPLEKTSNAVCSLVSIKFLCCV